MRKPSNDRRRWGLKLRPIQRKAVLNMQHGTATVDCAVWSRQFILIDQSELLGIIQLSPGACFVPWWGDAVAL